MPRSLIILESSRASPGALHLRRLYVSAHRAPVARLQTGATEVLQLQVLHNGAVRNLCGLRVYFSAARSPGEANNLLSAAQSLRRGGNSMVDSRQLQSVYNDENRRECARCVPGRSNRVEDGDRGVASEKSADEEDKSPEARGV